MCSKGCAIYANRPPTCKEWECEWLIGRLTEGDRPDKLGAIFDLADEDTLKVYLDRGIDEPTDAIRKAAGKLKSDRGVHLIIYHRYGDLAPAPFITAKEYRSKRSDKIDALTHRVRRYEANNGRPAQMEYTAISEYEWMYKRMDV
jgi:hypothetical protein